MGDMNRKVNVNSIIEVVGKYQIYERNENKLMS